MSDRESEFVNSGVGTEGAATPEHLVQIFTSVGEEDVFFEEGDLAQMWGDLLSYRLSGFKQSVGEILSKRDVPAEAWDELVRMTITFNDHQLPPLPRGLVEELNRVTLAAALYWRRAHPALDRATDAGKVTSLMDSLPPWLGTEFVSLLSAAQKILAERNKSLAETRTRRE